MNIQQIDLKHKLLTGSALVVMSGFIPPVAQQAQAGTATMPIDVEIVTGVNVANTNGLDFGRLALTGAVTGNNHTLSAAGVTTTAGGVSVVVAGTAGDFQVTGGTLAGNIAVSYTSAVTYNVGNIRVDQVSLDGVALTAPVVVAATGTATGALAGGGNIDVGVGARINFVAAPAVGTYTGNSATIIVSDIP